MDINSLNLSCQLGGFTLNGNVANGTAQNYTVVTINDPAAIIDTSSVTHSNKFIKIKVGQDDYYLPLYTST